MESRGLVGVAIAGGALLIFSGRVFGPGENNQPHVPNGRCELLCSTKDDHSSTVIYDMSPDTTVQASRVSEGPNGWKIVAPPADAPANTTIPPGPYPSVAGKAVSVARASTTPGDRVLTRDLWIELCRGGDLVKDIPAGSVEQCSARWDAMIAKANG